MQRESAAQRTRADLSVENAENPMNPVNLLNASESLSNAHLCACCGPSTSGRPSGWPAGCIASAITAACCSSTCATTTASRSACSRPSPRRFAVAEAARLESVISVTGKRDRPDRREHQPERCRPDASRSTSTRIEVLSAAETLPFQVAGTQEIPEEQRLRYRFLDLRREKIHANIVLRSKVISSIRRRMIEQGFLEFQTPILTSSSPEGARDYLVPSRIHPGKFYALPQAPQQFKQLLMVAGLRSLLPDRAVLPRRGRARRSVAGRVLSARRRDVVRHAGRRVRGDRAGARRRLQRVLRLDGVARRRFRASPYDDAMAMYGSDKPDLRNPIKARRRHRGLPRTRSSPSSRKAVEEGAVVRAIRAPGAAEKSRSFFDKTVGLGESLGLGGLAYIVAGRARRRDRSRSICPRSGATRIFDGRGRQAGRRRVLRVAGRRRR